MYEIDFLPVGDETKSGDAIVMRFNRPDTQQLAHMVIDGGFQQTGPEVVKYINQHYDTDFIDVVVVSHPDGDHIGGVGEIVRSFGVGTLLIHDLRGHGFTGRAADAVDELVALARSRGASVYQPFEGTTAFGGSLLVAGPSEPFYQQMVNEQIEAEQLVAKGAPRTWRLAEALARVHAKVLSKFPIEFDFDDAGGDNARNNSSTVIDLRLADKRFLFTADAGVDALTPALDYLDRKGRNDIFPNVIQVPHHGSRHNLDLTTIKRLAGPHTDSHYGAAVVSISKAAAEDPRYPSPRIANAFGRRGYKVGVTAGGPICYPSADATSRDGWHPITPLPPLDEEIDDR
jgi:beta-lactamase superfamily II metal-dependent hydrolase